jgi:hypothetical protein
LKAAGFDPEPVALLGDVPWDDRRSGKPELGLGRQGEMESPHYSWPGWRAVTDVIGGAATPETLVWNHLQATKRLEELKPHVVICVTLRAFSPRWITREWPVVIDLVDPLSQSYRQRSRLTRSPWRRSAFAVLARAAARAENHSIGRTVAVAAGWTDAQHLGVPWIPITAPATATTRPGVTAGSKHMRGNRWQALFIGSLDYPPNIDAVERLTTSIWPQVRVRHPGAVLGIGGRRPTTAVLAAARHPGVELIGEFGNLADIAPQAKLAVSPLRHATGFQIKVLDAALAGLPQVVSSAALAGFEPGLKVHTADSDEEIVEAVVRLLTEPAEAEVLAEDAGAQVLAGYGVARWAPKVRSLLNEIARPRPTQSTQTLTVRHPGQ